MAVAAGLLAASERMVPPETADMSMSLSSSLQLL